MQLAAILSSTPLQQALRFLKTILLHLGRVYTFAGSQIQLVNEYGAEYMAFGEAAVSVFFHGMGHYDLLAAP